MISWRMKDVVLEGAMGMLDGAAPFARAAPFLRSADDQRLLRAQRWAGDEVTGDPLTREELAHFVLRKEAFRWTDVSAVVVRAVPHLAVWILRPRFNEIVNIDEAVRQIKDEGAWVADAREPKHGAMLVAVREDLANSVRDEWATVAHDQAWSKLVNGQHDLARSAAEFSYVTTRGMLAERVALYAFSLERCEKKTRAEGLLIMAERSRGEPFGKEVRVWLDRYEQTVHKARPSVPARLLKVPPGVKQNEIPSTLTRVSF